MKWLGVTRAKRFSPGMADKDLAIMKAVADLLVAEGSQMKLCTEEKFETETDLDRWREVDGVFTMLRGEKALEQLQRLELKGIPVLNPTAGIRNAERKNITRLMMEHGIPMPQTWRVDETQMPDCSFPCWLKRADGWAQKRKDVAFAESREQLLAAAIEMRRGNPGCSMTVSEHLQGDLVKFYGVEGTSFFSWRYPDPSNTKFGFEKLNGAPQRFLFDEASLKRTCDALANVSHILVYGGDCIVDAQGCFRIIDFNDWPSFSSCRQEAACAIVKRMLLFLG